MDQYLSPAWLASYRRLAKDSFRSYQLEELRRPPKTITLKDWLAKHQLCPQLHASDHTVTLSFSTGPANDYQHSLQMAACSGGVYDRLAVQGEGLDGLDANLPKLARMLNSMDTTFLISDHRAIRYHKDPACLATPEPDRWGFEVVPSRLRDIIPAEIMDEFIRFYVTCLSGRDTVTYITGGYAAVLQLKCPLNEDGTRFIDPKRDRDFARYKKAWHREALAHCPVMAAKRQAALDKTTTAETLETTLSLV